jgi:hypothetical protein
MSFLRLTGPQLLRLRNLLKPAFTEQAFTELLLILDRKVEDFAGKNDAHPTVILNTLQHANAELWWRDLLREACIAVPDPQLFEFSKDAGFAPDVVTADAAGVTPLKGRNLELKIKALGSTPIGLVQCRSLLPGFEGDGARVDWSIKRDSNA